MTEAAWEEDVEAESQDEAQEEEEFESRLVTGYRGRVRYGTNLLLEEEADSILFAHLRNITNRQEKSDVLTPWKLKNRISHEVYTAAGFPDPSIRKGMYGRVLNRAKPHLNSRDGLARAAAKQEQSIAMTNFSGTSDA